MEDKKYDIFVSYSRKDIDVVEKLVGDIHAKTNARCWVDWSGIESGERFTDVIINAIENVDIVLFIMSDNSMSSDYVRMEIDYARNIGKKIIPVVVDGGKLRGWFLFYFGSIDYTDVKSTLQYDKFKTTLLGPSADSFTSNFSISSFVYCSKYGVSVKKQASVIFGTI